MLRMHVVEEARVTETRCHAGVWAWVREVWASFCVAEDVPFPLLQGGVWVRVEAVWKDGEGVAGAWLSCIEAESFVFLGLWLLSWLAVASLGPSGMSASHLAWTVGYGPAEPGCRPWGGWGHRDRKVAQGSRAWHWASLGPLNYEG